MTVYRNIRLGRIRHTLALADMIETICRDLPDNRRLFNSILSVVIVSISTMCCLWLNWCL